MILQSSVLAIAATFSAGALALASLAAPGTDTVTRAQTDDIVVHAASTAAPGTTRDLTVYDMLGHPQVSPAETYCDRHQVVVEGLTKDFAETLKAEKISLDGLRIELWTSDLMGTWTALHHGDDGVSCIVASGVDWTETADAESLLQVALYEVVYSW
jgi:hypothetical protein